MRGRFIIGAALALTVAAADARAATRAEQDPPRAAGPAESDSQQEASATVPGQTVYQETLEVRLVRMPIVARDRKNRPVVDLTAEEIVVKDQRRPVEVAYLEAFTPEPTARQGSLPEVRLHLGLPGGGERVVSSARVEPRNILFFIDVENDQKLGKRSAAEELVRFVLRDLDPSYRVAVLSFNGQVNIEQSFTSDRGAIGDALRAAFDRPPRPQIDLRLHVRQLISRVEDCTVDEGMFTSTANEECLRAVALEYVDENRPRSRDFLTALEGLIHFAGGLEGRKSVIAVSHGVAVNHGPVVLEAIKAVFGHPESLGFLELDLRTGEGTRAEMGEVVKLAMDNKVTLHFVDRSLEPASDYGASLRTSYQFGARPMHVAFTTPQLDLGEIAANTGGAFLASTDLGKGVRDAMALEQGAYELGFYTDHFLSAERLTKISVKSTRKGVQILHQRGVYARTVQRNPEMEIKARIALGRPLRSDSGAADLLKVPFQLIAEPASLGYEVGRDAASVTFTLHVLVSDTHGRRLADSYHLATHSYPLELWRAEDVEPVIIEGWVELPTGEYRLDARFRNPKTRQEGKISRELKIASRAESEKSTAVPSGVGDGS